MSAMKRLSFAPSLAPRVRLVTVEQCWTVRVGSRVDGPCDAGRFLMPYFHGKDREHFVALHLDAAHQPLSVEVVSIGSLNATVVHPREVFKGAILANARAIIAAHNHPSGGLEASPEDWETSRSLRAAGELLGIPLLDFLIVADDRTRSLEHA